MAQDIGSRERNAQTGGGETYIAKERVKVERNRADGERREKQEAQGAPGARAGRGGGGVGKIVL